MATNEQIGVEACLTDQKFRDTLKNHHTDKNYVSKELDRIGIDFTSDTDGSIRQSILDLIAGTDWSQLSEDLENLLYDANGTLHPFMG